MSCVFLIFFNYDVTFKIINKLKVNNDNFEFNSNFKNYVTIEITLKKYLTFSQNNSMIVCQFLLDFINID